MTTVASIEAGLRQQGSTLSGPSAGRHDQVQEVVTAIVSSQRMSVQEVLSGDQIRSKDRSSASSCQTKDQANTLSTTASTSNNSSSPNGFPISFMLPGALSASPGT